MIVERSPLSFLFLNNNLHFVHHKSPTVAWYRLPKLFRDRRDEWLRMNNGYAYPNYFALLKAYAFKAKEPIVHPVLQARAGAGPGVQAARQGAQHLRAWQRAGSRRAAEGMISAALPAAGARLARIVFLPSFPTHDGPMSA